MWVAWGPSQQDGKTPSKPRVSWSCETGGFAKICSFLFTWRIIWSRGKEVTCQYPTYLFWKEVTEYPFVCLGLSCDRVSSTASPLMESADCRKNAKLLSKFNDFMKINVSLLRLLLVRIHLILPFLWELNSCSTLQHINMFFSPHEIVLQARNNNVSASPCTFLLLPMNRSKWTIMVNIIHGDKFLTHFTENNK